ncbi:MAG: InlB B-repeat-containing protein, partial [Spirochaetales bacterium]|nr:InlB B-repeat-containing protein [Spirochaetales bacterium]
MTKNIYKYFITIYAVITALMTFCGCNNGVEPSFSDVVINGGQTATLSLSINENVSRSAVPTVTADNFHSLSLLSNDGNIPVIGTWDSYEQMRQAKVSMQTGTWELTLFGVYGSIVYVSEQEVTIHAGNNEISFTLMPAFGTATNYGYGNLEIKMSYPTTNVQTVTAGLYNLDEEVIVGFADETLTQQSGGKTVYTKDDIPSGSYIAIFKFFADTECKQILGTYREYVSIANEMKSESNCTISSLSSLYNITYQLGGGSFKNGYTAPGTFTRQSADLSGDIILPTADNVVKNGYVFGGWFDNADYDGNVVTIIPVGTIGNKTFYAKWKKLVTITFNANGGTLAPNVESTQTIVADETSDLKSSAELGLTNAKQRFLGWAETAGANPKYEDGGEIKTDRNMILYAKWSVATVDPKDTTGKDTDGDGLTDVYELTVSKTDPTNADTDGDGWSDSEELGLYIPERNIFSPRIADVPDLQLIITSKPSVDYKYTLTNGNTSTETQTLTEGTVASQSSTNTNSKTTGSSSTWSLANAFSMKHSFSPVGNPNVMSWEWSDTITVGKTWSSNNSDTYTYSTNESQSFSKNISNGHSSSETSSKTWTGGALKMMVKFKNPSSIAYHVDSLDIAVTRIPNNAGAVSVPVTSIKLSSIGTIPPGGETGEFVLAADLSVGATEELLKWSSGIKAEISGYTIAIQKNMDGNAKNDFTGALTRVWNKSANVSIDYGPTSNLNSETYFVSAKYKYNTGASTAEDLYHKPSLLEIMEDVLHIDRTSDKLVLNDDGRIRSIRGIENMNNPNLAETDVEEGGWYIMHTHTNENMKTVTDLYNMSHSIAGTIKGLSDITVSPKDNIHIFFNVDKDGDGVPANVELQHGTSDQSSDTDGDGLSDFDEIFGWYDRGKLVNKYTENNKCYSSPINNDSDGDDLFDFIKDYDTASEDKQNTTDSDPIIPKQKDIAEIKSAKYSVSANDKFKNITFNDKTATLNDLNEYIFLDIEPKLSFSLVDYSKNKDDANSWQTLEKTTQIKLDVGSNKIYVRVTAPDREHTQIWTINVNSVFRKMTGGKLTSPFLSDGKVVISWNDYSDDRAGSTYCGYVLYGHIGDIDMNNADKPARELVIDPDKYSHNVDCTNKGNFILSLTTDDMKKGSATVIARPNTHYHFGVFAFTNSNDGNKYKITCLYDGKIDTSNKEKGTLTFYAYYVKNYVNHDGGYDPEYYWSCYSDIFDKASDLNVSS